MTDSIVRMKCPGCDRPAVLLASPIPRRGWALNVDGDRLNYAHRDGGEALCMEITPTGRQPLLPVVDERATAQAFEERVGRDYPGLTAAGARALMIPAWEVAGVRSLVQRATNFDGASAEERRVAAMELAGFLAETLADHDRDAR